MCVSKKLPLHTLFETRFRPSRDSTWKAIGRQKLAADAGQASAQVTLCHRRRRRRVPPWHSLIRASFTFLLWFTLLDIGPDAGCHSRHGGNKQIRDVTRRCFLRSIHRNAPTATHTPNEWFIYMTAGLPIHNYGRFCFKIDLIHIYIYMHVRLPLLWARDSPHAAADGERERRSQQTSSIKEQWMAGWVGGWMLRQIRLPVDFGLTECVCGETDRISCVRSHKIYKYIHTNFNLAFAR